jgi:hypothetical protein
VRFVLWDIVAGGGGRPSSRLLPLPIYSDRNAITVNGVMHLCVQKRLSDDIIVLSLDLETEEWRKEIKGPPEIKFQCYKISLGELNGSLCLSRFQTYTGWTIWFLADIDNSVWIKAYTISFGATRYSELTPLGVLCDIEKLLLCGTPVVGGAQLQIYDPHDGTYTDVTEIIPHNYYAWNISLCSLHLKSFVSAKI